MRPVLSGIVSDKVTLIFKDIIELYPSFVKVLVNIGLIQINCLYLYNKEEMVATLKKI